MTAITTELATRPRRYRGHHRRSWLAALRDRLFDTVPAGATTDWSPAEDQHTDTDELTPTGLLESEPPATLDDGTVVGSRPLPSWEALGTDTHRALDGRWLAMLATFRARIDPVIARIGDGEPMLAAWRRGELRDMTCEWDATELREALAEASR